MVPHDFPRSTNSLSAFAISKNGGMISPNFGSRNSRIVGYHGESVRLCNHRKSAQNGTCTHTGRPSAPAR